MISDELPVIDSRASNFVTGILWFFVVLCCKQRGLHQKQRGLSPLQPPRGGGPAKDARVDPRHRWPRNVWPMPANARVRDDRSNASFPCSSAWSELWKYSDDHARGVWMNKLLCKVGSARSVPRFWLTTSVLRKFAYLSSVVGDVLFLLA